MIDKFVKIFVLIYFSFFPFVLLSQGLKVKDMHILKFDISASTNPRNGSNGIPCGLVKVQVMNSQLKFGDEVVGPVDNQLNEYWIYLEEGSKGLTIKCPDYLPMYVNFDDFGIDEIESKVCYLLKLDVIPQSKKNPLLLSVKPSSAKVIIDGISLDKEESGYYKLYITKGEHVVKMVANGYRPLVQVFKKDNKTKTIEVEMESLMASVDITCETEGTIIFINNEQYGFGSWNGSLPAGDYLIEARKEGYSTSEKQIVVNEKESINVVIPLLKQMQGDVRLISDASEYNGISLDGVPIEFDGNMINNIQSGKHILRICKYGYETVEMPIIVKGDGTDSVICKFIPRQECLGAINGNVWDQFRLGRDCVKLKDHIQAVFWFSKALNNAKGPNKLTMLYELISIYKDKTNLELYSLEKVKELNLVIVNDNSIFTDSSKWDEAVHKCWACIDIGDIYVNEGQKKTAIEWYKKGEEYIIEDWSSDYLKVGDCYLKCGELDKAASCFRHVLGSPASDDRKKAEIRIEEIAKLKRERQ